MKQIRTLCLVLMLSVGVLTSNATPCIVAPYDHDVPVVQEHIAVADVFVATPLSSNYVRAYSFEYDSFKIVAQNVKDVPIFGISVSDFAINIKVGYSLNTTNLTSTFTEIQAIYKQPDKLPFDGSRAQLARGRLTSLLMICGLNHSTVCDTCNARSRLSQSHFIL